MSGAVPASVAPEARVLAELLRAAGAVALAHFRRVDPEWKPDGSPVTLADRAVEAALVEALARAFPGEAIASEEGTRVSGPPGAPEWFVDPIDGTGSYVAGLADWGPTVVRAVGGRFQLGAFLTPRTGELWFGAAGVGAFRDGERLPRQVERPLRSDDLVFVPSRFHRRGRVGWEGKVRALGSSAAHLCQVAGGAGVAAVIPKWSPWDIGCGVILLREVGAAIWGPDGAPVVPEEGPPGLPIVCGAPNAMRALFADGWARGALAAPESIS